MNLAKKSKAGRFILCEGNIDVIALHQAGFDSAVASCGTAEPLSRHGFWANIHQKWSSVTTPTRQD